VKRCCNGNSDFSLPDGVINLDMPHTTDDDEAARRQPEALLRNRKMLYGDVASVMADARRRKSGATR